MKSRAKEQIIREESRKKIKLKIQMKQSSTEIFIKIFSM